MNQADNLATTWHRYGLKVDLNKINDAIERLKNENKDRSAIEKIEINKDVFDKICNHSAVVLEKDYPIFYGTEILINDTLKNNQFKITYKIL